MLFQKQNNRTDYLDFIKPLLKSNLHRGFVITFSLQSNYPYLTLKTQEIIKC